MTNSNKVAISPNCILKPRSCAQVQICTPGANMHPKSFFGNVNAVLRSGTRVQIVHMNAKCLISIHFDREF